METKLCRKCSTEKSTSDFYRHTGRPDGLQAYCKTCLKRSMRQRYLRNRRVVDRIKDQPCADCGKSYPPCVMDFDHVRGEKKFSIGISVTMKLSRLLDEIAKCDIVCSNCHRLRTHANEGLTGAD